ncbi:MAG: NAD(P)H-dependent oxidoreductase, partial [Candidatus Nezhaarchaeota archaeon]|nr:NAD(P)H-dependent oxidoreductase [Candidatus Nezhaarchaeota archaeon]
MKILIICGSLREKSLTRVLTNIAFQYARKYGEVEYLDLGKIKISNFQGFEFEYDENTKKAVKLVENADIIIIGSPIYNGMLCSGIKNLFEFIDYKALEGKAAGFILKASGSISFLQVQGQLQSLMNYFRVVSNPRSVFVTDEDFDGEVLK